MKRFVIIIIFIMLLSPAAAVYGNSGHSYYVVNATDDEDATCLGVGSPCSLKSAFDLADASLNNVVIQSNIPYKSIFEETTGESSLLPFYITKEILGEKTSWKIFPAPVVPQTDISGLKEDITDYFLTINLGIINSHENNNLIFSLLFSDFRKEYKENTDRNDYDTKNSIFRLFNIPFGGTEFSSREEVQNYINSEAFYNKIFLNGFHLRIYEESFSRNVSLIVFTFTAVIISLNLLVFPNLILYILFIIKGKEKTKSIGVVFDKETGQPISFATLRIYEVTNNNRRLLKQLVSDLNGRYYGFVVNKGLHEIEISHDQYSKKTVKKDVLTEEGILALDIDMSGSKIMLEENFFKKLRMSFVNNIKSINKNLIVVNFIISIVNIFLVQNLLTYLILVLAFIQFIVLKFSAKKKDWGLILDSKTRLPISAALVKVFDPTTLTQLDVQVSDYKGAYGFILEKGDYLISVEVVGYSFPSNSQDVQKISTSGEQSFIKFSVLENKANSQLTILLDRLV